MLYHFVKKFSDFLFKSITTLEELSKRKGILARDSKHKEDLKINMASYERILLQNRWGKNEI